MTRSGTRLVVTFDLFSALLDSRIGGSAAFDRLADARGWEVSGNQIFDDWDRRNKAAQRDCHPWVPWRLPAVSALAETYASMEVDADAAAHLEELVASMPSWPLWHDVAEGLPAVAEQHTVGLLSNVDDEVFRRTAAATLVDHEMAFTSERLRAYKPQALVYRRAVEQAGPDAQMVHVASSARDVRGALEAEIPVVRLRRPGHELDPGGPRPAHTVSSVTELLDVLRATERDVSPGSGQRHRLLRTFGVVQP